MEIPCNAPVPRTRQSYETWFTVLHWTRFSILVAVGVVLLAAFVGFDALAPTGKATPSDHVALDIMPVKAGGPPVNFAAYLPTTVLSVPAQRLVTITIRNFDLDPTPLAEGSPALRVQGTVGGVAYADGKAYTVLDRTGVAHTFTIPALHFNVPIPGHAASGKHYVTVTFQIRTGKAGVYSWLCLAPCGDGSDGESGAMADAGYMRGTLFVEG